MKEKKESKRINKNKPERPSLVTEILGDLFVKHWLVSILFSVVVISAMYQAETSHNARKAIAESQKLREVSQKQHIEQQELRLEMTSLSEANRISSLAKKQLKMKNVDSKNEKIITL